MQNGQGAPGNGGGSLRSADLQVDERRYRRNGHAYVEGLGGGSDEDRALVATQVFPPCLPCVSIAFMDRPNEKSPKDLSGPNSPHFSLAESGDEYLAWEQVDAGRFMPRRVRGSYQGRALG